MRVSRHSAMAEILMFEGQRPLHLADAYDARAEQRALREGIIAPASPYSCARPGRCHPSRAPAHLRLGLRLPVSISIPRRNTSTARAK